VDQTVTAGTFRLKGRILDEMSKARGMENRHQVSMRAGVSYPTIAKWFGEPESVESIHLPSLAGILVGALGMTPAEALKVRLGDLLEYVEDASK